MKRTSQTTVRVRFGETDQMGITYHGSYVVYFEIGRTEFMRSNGLCYADMEADGLSLAVVEMSAKYLKPARYDEELTIETELAEAKGVHVRFDYRIMGPSASNEKPLLCTGHTVLACVDRNGRPTRIKSPWREKIQEALSE